MSALPSKRVKKLNDSVSFEETVDSTWEHSEFVDQTTSNLEVEKLDQLWRIERESYRYSDYQFVAIRLSPTFIIVVESLIVVYGIIWTVAALLMSPMYALFGVALVVIGLIRFRFTYGKAMRYQRAKAKYLQRRQELLNGHDLGESVTSEPKPWE